MLYSKGNIVMVREPSGDMLYTVPEDFRVHIDGRDVPVSQLAPGTELIATINTVTRPRTVQTTQVIRGTVREVVGNNLMVTLESGEHRRSVVPAGFKFIVDGEEKSVNELKRGMKLRATIIQKKQEVVTETTTVVHGLPRPPSR